jgi:hypothetical protein
MGALHLAFWLIATGFGLRFLGAGFKATQARSSVGLVVWSIIFLLVALQMTAALRPILGQADTVMPTEKKFFLKHWVDCASASLKQTDTESGGGAAIRDNGPAVR